MTSSVGTGPAVGRRPAGSRRPAWRTVNITPAERLGRIVVGLAAVAAGLDLAVTGALGHCPLYVKLGYLPKSLRRTR